MKIRLKCMFCVSLEGLHGQVKLSMFGPECKHHILLRFKEINVTLIYIYILNVKMGSFLWWWSNRLLQRTWTCIRQCHQGHRDWPFNCSKQGEISNRYLAVFSRDQVTVYSVCKQQEVFGHFSSISIHIHSLFPKFSNIHVLAWVFSRYIKSPSTIWHWAITFLYHDKAFNFRFHY